MRPPEKVVSESEVESLALLADGRIYVFDRTGRVTELNDVEEALALLIKQSGSCRGAKPTAYGPEEPLSVFAQQATGMIAAQYGCGVNEARARLRIVAKVTSQTLDDVAFEVINGLRRFGPASD